MGNKKIMLAIGGFFLSNFLLVLLFIVMVAIEPLRETFIENDGIRKLFVIGNLLYLIIFITVIFLKNNKLDDYKTYILKENVPSEFELLYENLYNKHYIKLEMMRRKARVLGVLGCIPLLLGIGGLLYLCLYDYIPGAKGNRIIILIFSIVVFNTIYIFANKFNKLYDKYKHNYIKEISSNFVKLANTQLSFNDIESYYISKEYRESGFDKDFDGFELNHYIDGNIEEKHLQLSEIKVGWLGFRTRVSSRRIDTVLFEGLFSIITFDKEIPTYIKITKNKVNIPKEDFENIDLEEFKKYFDVYTEDENMFKNILNYDIMKYIIDFYKKYKLEFGIVFYNNKIYLRFLTSPVFKLNLFNKSMYKKSIFIDFYTLKIINDFCEKISAVFKTI